MLIYIDNIFIWKGREIKMICYNFRTLYVPVMV